jgi:sulfur carrier protein ThiS
MTGPKEESMPAKFILRNKEYEVRSGMTVLHCLEKIGIQPETVLATRKGELITEDEIVHEGDVIKLVAVISGG